jgi:hypothetical protein
MEQRFLPAPLDNALVQRQAVEVLPWMESGGSSARFAFEEFLHATR